MATIFVKAVLPDKVRIILDGFKRGNHTLLMEVAEFYLLRRAIEGHWRQLERQNPGIEERILGQIDKINEAWKI